MSLSDRGAAAPVPSPGTFRCLVCKRTVTGTAAGHCPTCGYVPPRVPVVAAPRAPRGPRPRTDGERTLALGIAALGILAFVILQLLR